MQITRRNSGKKWQHLIVAVIDILDFRVTEILQETHPVLDVEANLKLRHNFIIRRLMRDGDNEATLIHRQK